MKNNILVITLLLCISNSVAQWRAVGDKIKTTWGENLDPKKVHQEYPRPILQRPQWKNLNGLWDYAITPKGRSKPERSPNGLPLTIPVVWSIQQVGKPFYRCG